MEEFFLSLIRLGIGTETVSSSWTSQAAEPSARFHVPSSIDWNALEELAARQGLSAVLVDGIERLPDELRPPKLVLLQWIGEVLQGYEYRYEQYRKAIADLAGIYNEHGFKMMVLKGYACALDWPRPEHRRCGDIDVWLFGEQKAADAALLNLNDNHNDNEGSPDGSKSDKNLNQNHIEIDNSHHHHSVFNWGEFMVENHYDFIDVHHRKSGPKLEAIFKELGNLNVESSEFRVDSQLKECSDAGCKIPSVELNGQTIYLPSANLHALFLVYHTMLHFTSTEMSIRQILDWGLFVKAHTNEIDWDWLLGLVEEFHLREFLNIINAICVEELGFDSSIFHGVQFNPVLKDRVLNDTFNPEFSGQEPSNFLKRIWFRYRRWKSHEWKHQLCFDESMWSIFWSAVWSHILKPGSI